MPEQAKEREVEEKRLSLARAVTLTMCQSNTLQGPELHTGKWWDATKLSLTLHPLATTSAKLKFMSGGCAQGPAAAAAVPGTSTHSWRAQARLALPVGHQVGELVSGTVECFLLCRNGGWSGREAGRVSGQKEREPSAKLLFGLITIKLLIHCTGREGHAVPWQGEWESLHSFPFYSPSLREWKN